MDASSYNILLIWIFGFCLNVFDIVIGKLCYTTIGKSIADGHNSIYNKKLFCCDNSEHKDNKCIECETGFLSIHGEPCKSCPTDSFGRKCSGACKCKMYESCNNVLGCITMRTEKTVTGHTDKEETTYKDGVTDIVTNVFLYTICTGSLAFVMVLVSLTWTWHRREKRKSYNLQKDTQGGNIKKRSAITIL